MTSIMTYLIPIAIVLGFAMLASLANREFSKNIFLTSIAVGIAIMIWIPMLPSFLISLSILCIIAMIFADRGYQY